MDDGAVAVTDLGKQYQITRAREPGKTFREELVDFVTHPRRRWRSGQPSAKKSIWALRGVSFRVARGEVLGIVGRNGAGKSTLLKILSRVTDPSEGRAVIRGRVGALLEIGTGFHAELTGRENIFLNSAILGMRRFDVKRRFDDIVSFADLEEYIDTPVKRYSSGMYMRLAFSVAAHLEPEILIVDEVLAVGDAQFQKRCLQKMGDVASEGRTVLFVSHNMPAIKRLCQRAILLDSGQVVLQGSVSEVVGAYLRPKNSEPARVFSHAVPHSGTGDARIRQVEVLDAEGNAISNVYLGQPFRICLTIEVIRPVEDAIAGIYISTLQGTVVTASYSCDDDQPPWSLPAGWHRICLDLRTTLLPQQYTVDVSLHHSNGTDLDFVAQTVDFDGLNVASDSNDSFRWTRTRGFVRPAGVWHRPALAEPLSIHSSEG